MQEDWRSVCGFEGYYEVSNFGNVRSVSRHTASGNRKGKPLKLQSNGNYLIVSLCKCGIKKLYLVHRLVAIAFLPNPNNYPCINHKDENKENNRVDNLEWCTYAYNNSYSDVTKKGVTKRLGVPLSVEHKEKLSRALKQSGERRAVKRKQTLQERYPNGLPVSDTQRESISMALKGKKKTDEHRQHMRKPKSPEHIEHMREAQRISHMARKLGMTYKEYMAKYGT